MKIGIDIREAVKSKRAGKSWYTFEIVEGLLKQNIENTDIHYILYTDQPYPDWEHYPNVTQKFFPPSGLRWHFSVLKDLKKEKPDLYFAPTSYIVPAFAPKWLRTVVTIHDLVAWLFPVRHNLKATLIERLTLPLAVRRAEHFITVSENTKKDLKSFFCINSANISVIPCGVSEKFRPFSPQEKEEFRRDKKLPERFLLSVGTLEPRKNFKTLIAAYAKIIKHHPDVKLVIAGGKGWKYEEIFDEVEKRNLKERVIFAGYVDDKDLPGYYNTALAFIFPSLYEGFGIPPLEAMRCGCPVICSNTSSLPEVVGDSAILIGPDSVEEICIAMLKILANVTLRAELSQKGLVQSQKFSWDASAQLTRKLFMELIKGL